MKIKKGDKVLVLSGKDKNKTAIVERVYQKTGEVLATGVNKVKKHVKVSKKFPSGGIVEMEKPMPVSKVELICPNCGKATRVSYQKKNKEKNRICKKCNKEIIQKTEGKEK